MSNVLVQYTGFTSYSITKVFFIESSVCIYRSLKYTYNVFQDSRCIPFFKVNCGKFIKVDFYFPVRQMRRTVKRTCQT